MIIGKSISSCLFSITILFSLQFWGAQIWYFETLDEQLSKKFIVRGVSITRPIQFIIHNLQITIYDSPITIHNLQFTNCHLGMEENAPSRGSVTSPKVIRISIVYQVFFCHLSETRVSLKGIFISPMLNPHHPILYVRWGHQMSPPPSGVSVRSSKVRV